eukprot:COSAG01_NODE_128_length_24936_cov_324.347264_16_plen_460_part_00
MSDKKLWGGRFEGGLSQEARDFSYTLQSDLRLVQYDLQVNQAQAQLLTDAGVLTAEENDTLQRCLVELSTDFKDKPEDLLADDEDIHSCVERLVTARCGDLGKKLHTGKSRNDQVITDVRFFVKHESDQVQTLLRELIQTLIQLAEAHEGLVFPGFTHFQVAQPVLFAHHCLAYVEMLQRDIKRFESVYASADVCALGSAALAGNNYGLDREKAREIMGFASLTANSMDAVADRDFIFEALSASALSMLHLSRLSEELVLWSSDLLGFVTLGDDYSTGSSIMPQKKNPDIAELIRGKSARVSANVTAMMQLLKALPLTYNRDLQEDKPLLFDSVDTLKASLTCMRGMLKSLTVNPDAISAVLNKGYALATELADYLVKKGLPFRDCHHICGEVVRYAIKEAKSMQDLSLDEFKQFSSAIEQDVYDVLTFEAAVASKSVYGGTAPEQVKQQLKRLKERYY